LKYGLLIGRPARSSKSRGHPVPPATSEGTNRCV